MIDWKKVPVRTMKLEMMMNIQEEFLKQVIPNYDCLLTNEREHWTKEMVLAAIKELTELLDEINWKHWKKHDKEIDMEKLHYEIIDIVHFLLNIILLWGMNSNMVYQMYAAKAIENRERRMKAGLTSVIDRHNDYIVQNEIMADVNSHTYEGAAGAEAARNGCYEENNREETDEKES